LIEKKQNCGSPQMTENPHSLRKSPSPAETAFDWDAPEITMFLHAALDEDIRTGDLTTMATVAEDARARARLVARRQLVLAGMPLFERVFRALDSAAKTERHFAEGDEVPADGVIAHVEGLARAILTGERTALNLLSHLSGVATLTRRFVRAAEGTRIRDTRKTQPLLRRLQKYAVRAGGGVNHRMSLDDAMLIKENHIAAAGSLREAVRRARAFLPGGRETTAYEAFEPPPAAAWDQAVEIQVEVRNEDELREALAVGANSLLLDNMRPEDAARLVALARGLRRECFLEVSGGITLENVRAFALSGVDAIAIGALTHSAPAADLSLLVEMTRHG
jgi:nicotinate-nucleotide pyrophosphorylase (carboxylating)